MTLLKVKISLLKTLSTELEHKSEIRIKYFQKTCLIKDNIQNIQRTLKRSGKKATPVKHGPKFLKGFSGGSIG